MSLSALRRAARTRTLSTGLRIVRAQAALYPNSSLVGALILRARRDHFGLMEDLAAYSDVEDAWKETGVIHLLYYTPIVRCGIAPALMHASRGNGFSEERASALFSHSRVLK